MNYEINGVFVRFTNSGDETWKVESYLLFRRGLILINI